MGRTLQIRVSATTFDPAEVERRWPRLSALAFSPDGKLLAGEPGTVRGIEK